MQSVRFLLAACIAASLLSGCVSEQRQAGSNLPLSGEASAPTPLPPTYVKILASPEGPYKDNATNEWFIDQLTVQYRADDFNSFNPLFDVSIEKDGTQVFNRLGVPGDIVQKGYFTELPLKLWNKPVLIGYAGDYTVRVQMRPYRGKEVNYTDEKVFSLN